jgi:hypothetical protein
MPNKSYRDFKDELQNDDDYQPYDSVSSRDPLIDLKAPSIPSEPSQSDVVKNAILSKMAPQPVEPSAKSGPSSGYNSRTGDFSNDPMMKQFEQNQSKLDDYRRAKLGSDYINNLGSAFSQIAQGVNAPKQNTELYSNIQKQGAEALKSNEEDSDRRSKVVSAIEQRMSREGIAADNRDARALAAKQHSQDLAMKYKEMADYKQNAADTKAKDAQDKAYTTMRHELETFRGNQAAQQAAVKVQNADTALAIVKNKDPNSLTVQDLTLLAEEMGKIATGGVPTEHGVQALMPNTMTSKFAAFQSFLANKPTDAQAGEFIKHNMEYLEQMKDVAKDTLNTYRSNIAKGYKSRVRDDQYGEAAQDYGFGSSKSGLSAQDEKKMSSQVPVKMQAPDGSIRLVPSAQVDAAIAAGGKRL